MLGVFVCLNYLDEKFISEKKRKLQIESSMGHLVNPIGVRLGYSLTWAESWNASNKSHYLSHYNHILLARIYTNYYFSREYIENFGIFFSHFGVFWSSDKFIVEINLYDGRVEDWIETCINLFSQDFKRLAVYSLKTFKQNSRSAEFSRSANNNFFKFLTLLVFKLIFKTKSNLLQIAYLFPLLNDSSDKVAKLLYKLVDFLVLKSQSEDLVIKKINNTIRFFLRFYCLAFYQIPLYQNLINNFKSNFSLFLNEKIQVVVLGVENKNVTSIFISRFLSRKLAQKYRWAELMTSIRRDLNYMTDTEKFFYGYKIQFHGRFTRRSRSESVTTNYGRVSTSTIKASIDYSISNLILRNGSGSIKVWLYRAPRFKFFSYRII